MVRDRTQGIPVSVPNMWTKFEDGWYKMMWVVVLWVIITIETRVNLETTMEKKSWLFQHVTIWRSIKLDGNSGWLSNRVTISWAESLSWLVLGKCWERHEIWTNLKRLGRLRKYSPVDSKVTFKYGVFVGFKCMNRVSTWIYSWFDCHSFMVRASETERSLVKCLYSSLVIVAMMVRYYQERVIKQKVWPMYDHVRVKCRHDHHVVL